MCPNNLLTSLSLSEEYVFVLTWKERNDRELKHYFFVVAHAFLSLPLLHGRGHALITCFLLFSFYFFSIPAGKQRRKRKKVNEASFLSRLPWQIVIKIFCLGIRYKGRRKEGGRKRWQKRIETSQDLKRKDKRIFLLFGSLDISFEAKFALYTLTFDGRKEVEFWPRISPLLGRNREDRHRAGYHVSNIVCSPPPPFCPFETERRRTISLPPLFVNIASAAEAEAGVGQKTRYYGRRRFLPLLSGRGIRQVCTKNVKTRYTKLPEK